MSIHQARTKLQKFTMIYLVNTPAGKECLFAKVFVAVEIDLIVRAGLRAFWGRRNFTTGREK